MDTKLKIVIDDDIPFIKGVIEPFANVDYIKGSKITSAIVKGADALIIRTRTNCDYALLNDSNVKFIASATIGKDHVDIHYCKENGIYFTNASGCNAWGVVQYVVTSIFTMSEKRGLDLTSKTMGIIGAGNVGERLAITAKKLGFNILRCDPPLKEALISNPNSFKNDELRYKLRIDDYYSLEEVLEKSDIISLHVPLDMSTQNMADNTFFDKIKEGTIFINSSRGEVVDEEALIAHKDKFAAIIIDVWKGEPRINKDLLNISDISTPHIAGYSFEGKVNATKIVVNKLGDFFNINELKIFDIPNAPNSPINISIDKNSTLQKNLFLLFYDTFPIFEVDKVLRDNFESFEQIRSNYVYRREFSNELISLAENLISNNNVYRKR